MRIGPRYKIARRLGAGLFEKTQSQKYILRAGRRGRKTRPASRSDFGNQMREKQRARMFYGISERQFRRYVREAAKKRNTRRDEALFISLETRLDNVIYRLGFAPSRQAARQMSAHGHFTVNGIRVTAPSQRVRQGDVIQVRAGSARKPLFAELADKTRDHLPPTWLHFDRAKTEATVVGLPRMVRNELPFDIAAILEFYRR